MARPKEVCSENEKNKKWRKPYLDHSVSRFGGECVLFHAALRLSCHFPGFSFPFLW